MVESSLAVNDVLIVQFTEVHQPSFCVSDLTGLAESLRSTINPRLTLLARTTGFFSTAVFKMNGVQVWHDYGVGRSLGRMGCTWEGEVLENGNLW